MYRLNKLSSKLNVPINRLIDALKKKTGVDYNPSSKLTDDEINILVAEFKNELDSKNLAQRFLKDCYFKIDEDFVFGENESKNYPNEFDLYKKSLFDIELLKNSLQKYEYLDNDEKQTLLNLKLATIESIQKTIFIYRNNKQNTIAKKDKSGIDFNDTTSIDVSSVDNPWRKVFGDDEEASTAYWNTD